MSVTRKQGISNFTKSENFLVPDTHVRPFVLLPTVLLVEENEIVNNNNGKIATIMNRYFTNITLNI